MRSTSRGAAAWGEGADMPRMVISVLAFERAFFFLRNLCPALWLALRSALGQEGEDRKQDEILQRQDDGAHHAGNRRHGTQIGLPQPAQSRFPQEPVTAPGRNTGELCKRVVHVKSFI